MPRRTRRSLRSSWLPVSVAQTSRTCSAQRRPTTREQLALVQRTEVARAKPRREMRLVVVVTLGFVLATVTIGHGYFTPFSTTTGQIVLRPDRRALRRGLCHDEPALPTPARCPGSLDRWNSRHDPRHPGRHRRRRGFAARLARALPCPLTLHAALDALSGIRSDLSLDDL